MTRAEIFAAIEAERERQKVVHPESERIGYEPSEANSIMYSADAELFRRMAAAVPTSAQYIVLSEVFEVFAERDPAKQRGEIIQVMAVCLKWLECLSGQD